ncbi:Hypothetical protein, putative [Bodo saltans]|uniref:Sulfotransferase n=1 Tax=Bodo saltans TaxID=75058 RepID=A0A0S4J6G2_BODSA|nr:Hypothetical protein, putative [Bodo saltans]|eukprot:CUG84789.1 Hypothetical protein, putative [Bodo saltans]
MFLKSMNGVRDLSFRSMESMLRRLTLSEVRTQDFDFEQVVDVASKAAGTTSGVPDEEWWKKLCRACQDKACSTDGRRLLHTKLIHSLSQRLAVEEAYRLNETDIEKEKIESPFVVMGLPRSNGHMITHVFARSGLFLCPRMQDTWSPSIVVEADRAKLFKTDSRRFERQNPNFACVRRLVGSMADDDLTLNLHIPQSFAWGLLHGLDEYLLQTIQEDQSAVFEYTKKVLKLFQWYRKFGHFSDCVKVEFNVLDNPIEVQRTGPKHVLSKLPWLIHSPLGILNAESLHKAFPDMNVIWTHRALASGISSLCSTLAIHNSLYTGKKPSETALAQIGEKVLGIFGSGTENAIDYFGNFDKSKMVHWSNRDANRHCTRLMMKTMEHFNLDIDRHRRMHGIEGQTEFSSLQRPLHDSNLQYFGLHEGVVHQVFDAYVHQFEEFAFEKRFGVTVQDYVSLGETPALPSLNRKQSRVDQFAEGQPAGGHFLSQH